MQLTHHTTKNRRNERGFDYKSSQLIHMSEEAQNRFLRVLCELSSAHAALFPDGRYPGGKDVSNIGISKHDVRWSFLKGTVRCWFALFSVPFC